MIYLPKFIHIVKCICLVLTKVLQCFFFLILLHQRVSILNNKQMGKQTNTEHILVCGKHSSLKQARGPKFAEHKQNCEHNETHTVIKAASNTFNLHIHFHFLFSFHKDYHFQFQKHWILLIFNIHSNYHRLK